MTMWNERTEVVGFMEGFNDEGSELLLLGTIILLLGLAVLWYLWPEQKAQQSQAVFSYLQFAVTVPLVLLTYRYVVATNALVEAQNKLPAVSVIDRSEDVSDPETTIDFLSTIGDRSVYGTSIHPDSVNVTGQRSRNVTFEGMKTHAVVEAARVLNIRLDARFGSVPVAPGIPWSVELTFSDVVRGQLPVVRRTF